MHTAPLYAFSVKQPWASLIACGIKTLKTSDVEIPPGRYALHASNQRAANDDQICDEPAVKLALSENGWPEFGKLFGVYEGLARMPKGVVIAVVTLGVPITWHHCPAALAENYETYGDVRRCKIVCPVVKVEVVRPHIPLRGRLGLFKVPPSTWRTAKWKLPRP